MLDLATTLFPICRSITGDGVRETLRHVGERIELDVHEVASGTPVLDWVVPPEWNVRDAYIADTSGARIVDFRESNLHVLGYSEPIRAVMAFDELRDHLHVHPTELDWIPYRTSYYTRTWGFCVTQRQLARLEEGGPYDVVIDSSIEAGSLTYGECVIPGAVDAEVILSTHVCHPSLANENLSGIAVLTELASKLASRSRRLSYRLLFIPGTIGSITWLARNEDARDRVVAGFVLACLGDAACLAYKRSRQGSTVVDRAAEHVVTSAGGTVTDFEPWGWDERQFNSPGFNLPIGRLARSAEGAYPEYHASADNLDLIDGARLEEALEAASKITDILDADRMFLNSSPKGEPQLGRRGFFTSAGGAGASDEELAALWVLNQADGTHSLLDTAIQSGLPFDQLAGVARRLVDVGLLEPMDWALP